MHLTILSRSSAIYTTRRLADAARLAGHKARVLNPLRCELFLDGAATGLFYRRKPFPKTDVCLPRIAPSVQTYGLAVLEQLNQQGVPLLNGAVGIARSRNKLRCLQHLAAQGVPVPATVMATDAADLRQMAGMVGGCPVLVRLQHGSERMGIMVCETEQSLEAALEALLGLGHNLVVQQYVREAKGRDIRALVVGGRVVAAVARVLRVGRLIRTLGSKSARYAPVQLSEEHRRIAESCARLVELEVAAVDMLDLSDGPRVFDVNSSPGFQEIEEVTGVDAARAVVERAVELNRQGRALKKRSPSPQALPREQPLTLSGAGATVRTERRSRGKR